MNRRKFTKTTIGAIAGVATLGSVVYGKDLKSKQRKTMKIVLGADSFAYSLKKAVAEHLKKRNIEVIDTDNYATHHIMKLLKSRQRLSQMVMLTVLYFSAELVQGCALLQTR